MLSTWMSPPEDKTQEHRQTVQGDDRNTGFACFSMTSLSKHTQPCWQRAIFGLVFVREGIVNTSCWF